MKKLIIGIDIRPYLYDKSGIGQYIYQLTENLIKTDNSNSYVLFADREFSLDFEKKYKKVIFSSHFPKLNTILYHLKTICFSKKYCDIYLTASSLYVPAIRPQFSLFVIHDLVMLKYPKMHTAKTIILSRLFLRLALRNAKAIIAVSQTTKLDILSFFPKTQENKLHVIAEGVHTGLKKYVENDDNTFWNETQKKFGIQKRYILYVGTIQPRKNVSSLIRAFEELKRDDVQLVLVGKMGWNSEEIEKLLSKHKRMEDIILTGFVSEKEKAYMYKNAFCLVYPSFYEGFGIPLLEAMLFSLPFISSNVSSLPEVAGEAGILINPHNYKEITEALTKLLTDPSLYQTLQKNGKKQLVKYNWENISREWIQLFEQTR